MKVPVIAMLILLVTFAVSSAAQGTPGRSNGPVKKSGKKGGEYTINIYNTTDIDAFVYIDGKQAFVVEGKQKFTGYVVKNIKKISASSFDKKVKWGPLDLKKQDEDFYWKLVDNKENE